MKKLLSVLMLSGLASCIFAQKTIFPKVFVNNNLVFVQDSVLTYDQQSSGALYAKESNLFNDNHDNTASLTMNWDPVWEVYMYKTKVEYIYNDAGNLKQEEFYQNMSTGMDTGYDWKMFNYKEYFWTGAMLDSVRNYRQSTDNTFFVCDKIINTYNKEGQKVSSSTYVRYNIESTLALSKTFEYTDFNSFGKPAKCTTAGYYNNEVISSNTEIYTYDEAGNLTIVESHKMNEEGEDVRQNQRTYTFNNGVITQEVYYSNDAYTGEWGPFYRWEFQYDATNKFIKRQEYYVYNMDFTASPMFNYQEYYWRKVESTGLSEIGNNDVLKLSISDGNVLLNYAGELQQIILLDTSGRTMKIVNTTGNEYLLNTCHLKGCYIVLAKGDKGYMIRKIIL